MPAVEYLRQSVALFPVSPLDNMAAKRQHRRQPAPLPVSPLESSNAGISRGLFNKSSLESPIGSGCNLLVDSSPGSPLSADGSDSGLSQNLCPFCDQVLPPHPSSIFLALLETAVQHSIPSPRPGNLHGRRAENAEIFIPACQRHRFEQILLPQAKAEGWPTDIRFEGIESRVRALRNELSILLTDRKTLEKNSLWMALVSEYKESGTLAATKVQNQFANFDNARLGYYGEQGMIIVQAVLYDMFPPNLMNLSAIHPVPPIEFIGRILAPYAALRLIANDLLVSNERALDILRSSSAYGAAMFPVDDSGSVVGCGNGLDVAEGLMHRRAVHKRATVETDKAFATERLRVARSRKFRSLSGLGHISSAAQFGRPHSTTSSPLEVTLLTGCDGQWSTRRGRTLAKGKNLVS